MLPNLGGGEWMIILVVVLLLFGSAKLPQLARSLGKSARILKAETKGLRDDEDETTDAGKQAKAQAEARDQAAKLREEAARLEREATGDTGGTGAPQRPRGALASGEPIQGIPVPDPGQARKSG
ncbi:Sec-independent protein translocase subunit TatA [Actinomadura rubrisoli]|uniref:Sec-independent protein translocase protein TatA n=1 Tax=Actinomadura rubrisoli TaxID=2530368 RepID=A0A4R5A6G6_9ACTN|nr:Sec-independent protein translocase subunit TatA [Actinomadura rubrisoli]TDD66650.1 twin-arginine translocase TatA/TatE family subunit [Actinomadura rubrisoli]